MHNSVIEFVRRTATKVEIENKLILEIGSYNVNGSVRSVIEPLAPAGYIGTDLRLGPDVDIACDVEDLTYTFREDAFDVVISTEMLEHAIDWRGAIEVMKSLVMPGGVIILTTRSPGFMLHDYPADYWRFTLPDMENIFSDFIIEDLETDIDPGMPGVFIKARKPSNWIPINLDNIEVAKAP